MTWTLKAHFAVPRDEICAAVQRFVAQSSVSVDSVTLDAVGRFATFDVDLAECVPAAASAGTGLPIVTYDLDYRKFADVTAKCPRELHPDGKA